MKINVNKLHNYILHALQSVPGRSDAFTTATIVTTSTTRVANTLVTANIVTVAALVD